MFTKEDYINYLNEIKKVELQMVDNVNGLKRLIPDPDIHILLDVLHADEVKHLKWETEMINSLDKQY